MKKHIKALLCVVMSILLVFCAAAEEMENTNGEPEITSAFAVVYNLENDKILYAKDNKSIIYPASLVKIMTGALAVEYYENNHSANFDVTVTDTALAHLQGNNIKLTVGEKITYENLLYALLVGSANDAACVLAETVAGSVEKFVDMMNAKAAELGAADTYFTNPTGYHSPYMTTTLDDMIKICTWAYRNNTFMEISSCYKYTIPQTNLSDERYLQSQNLLLNPSHWGRYYIEGAVGMNSGATNESGYCLATVAQKGGLTNLVIITGGKAEGAEYLHFRDAGKLFDYAFSSFENKTVVKGKTIICELPVEMSSGVDHAVLTTENDITCLFNKSVDVEKDLEIKYTTVDDKLIAPVTPGVSYGILEVYYENELIASTNLVSQMTVDRSNFLYMLGNLKSFLMTWQAKLIIGIVVTLTILYIIFRAVVAAALRRHRNRKGDD